jgi:D-glycero-D-manno-heptose 1,7-bisphosphate phosphatase
MLVVVSNQSGVGRGIIPAENLPKVHARLDELLQPFGVKIDHYACCLHHPDADCECRKPKPKLLIDSAQKLGIALSKSFMVGDRDSDVLAGISAGCRASIFLKTSAEQNDFHPRASFVAQSLPEATHWILGQA